jgi:hypothetical protein
LIVEDGERARRLFEGLPFAGGPEGRRERSVARSSTYRAYPFSSDRKSVV